jgi:uncharacterized membrane protein
VASRRSEPTTSATAAEAVEGPRRAVTPLEVTALVIAVLGICVAGYLTYEHFTSSTSLACPETGVVNCAKVTTSSYSAVFGIPVALLGLLFFVAMTVLSIPAVKRTPVGGTLRLAASAGGVAFVFYLVWAELFQLNAICLWCTGVHVLTIALFAVVVFDWAFRVDT